jgi:hypothetical protein
MSRLLRVSATVALVAALLPAFATAADPLPGKSPFGPPAETTKGGAAATAPDGDYELMGMVATPKGPMLSIARQGANKGTLWIPVGGSREEITVVSYDARHERAVIRVKGHSRTLTMRKSVIVAGENTAPEPEAEPAPEAAPAPDSSTTETDPTAAAETLASDASSSDATANTAPAPEPSSPPASDEAAAEEARNLVSDLMDIGQQQRQAYEAAARAAGQTTAEPEATPPTDESAVEPTPDSEPAPAADESAQPTGSEDTDPANRSDDRGGS